VTTRKSTRSTIASPSRLPTEPNATRTRRDMEAAGKVSKGDGKDVDHKTAIKNGGGNTKDNLRVVDKATNRGWRKGKTGYTP